MFRTPTFWQKRSLGGALLLPVGWLLWSLARLRRRIVTPATAPLPVICIGNVTAGGTGKTPVVIALSHWLTDHGHRPHILSRGYGGQAHATPLRVDPARHTARKVGDEPLLLAQAAPCWVSADRVATARAAAATGATILLLDDGFQNPSMHKNLSILVFDGGIGIGNGWPMPAGPLREPLADGLARADAAIVIGENTTGLSLPIPTFTAELQPDALPPGLTNRPLVAFAGIGRPEKFFAMLRSHGMVLAHAESFPDHHAYTTTDLARLEALADGATLVTTVKDHVRLPADVAVRVVPIPVSLTWEETFIPWLKRRLDAWQ